MSTLDEVLEGLLRERAVTAVRIVHDGANFIVELRREDRENALATDSDIARAVRTAAAKLHESVRTDYMKSRLRLREIERAIGKTET